MRTESPTVDIHQLVTDIANHNREADFEHLWQLLSERELFVPVRQPVPPGNAAPFPVATMPNGMKLTPFFLDRGDPRLGRHSVAFGSADAFRRTLADEKLDGLLLQSRTQAWVAVSRAQVERVVRDFLR